MIHPSPNLRKLPSGVLVLLALCVACTACAAAPGESIDVDRLRSISEKFVSVDAQQVEEAFSSACTGFADTLDPQEHAQGNRRTAEEIYTFNFPAARFEPEPQPSLIVPLASSGVFIGDSATATFVFTTAAEPLLCDIRLEGLPKTTFGF